MKKLVQCLFMLFAVVALLSNSEGRGTRSGQGASNAPGDGATCSNSSCHGSSTFNPSITLNLTKDGEAVDAYRPGEEYDMELVINSSGANAFGFQLTAALSDASQAGSFSDLSQNVQSLMLNERTYLEHFEASAANVFRAKWTAPASGSGNVDFFSAGIAANGNGNKSGDGGTSSKVTIAEDTSSNTNDLIAAKIKVYPNPTNGLIHIDTKEEVLSYAVFNIAGQTVTRGTNNLIDLTDNKAGIYLVQIQTQSGVSSQRVSLVE